MRPGILLFGWVCKLLVCRFSRFSWPTLLGVDPSEHRLHGVMRHVTARRLGARALTFEMFSNRMWLLVLALWSITAKAAGSRGERLCIVFAFGGIVTCKSAVQALTRPNQCQALSPQTHFRSHAAALQPVWTETSPKVQRRKAAQTCHQYHTLTSH